MVKEVYRSRTSEMLLERYEVVVNCDYGGIGALLGCSAGISRCKDAELK